MKGNKIVSYKFFLSCICLIVVLFIGCGGNQKSDNSSTVSPSSTAEKPDLTTIPEQFIDSNTGITIHYPKDWQRMDKVMGSLVAFLSPREDSSDLFQENVNILVQDLSKQPMTLNDYLILSVNQVKQMITGAGNIETGDTTLAGNPAKKVSYTGKQGVYNLKWQQIYVIKNNHAYVITLTASVDKFDKYLPIFQNMLNSFELK